MNDRIDALERLHKLHAQGVLSEQEYAREKAAIIGQAHDQSEPTEAQPQARLVQPERQALVWSFSLKRALTWALAAMLICAAIGGYFFVKAYNLAKERGEVSQPVVAASSTVTAPAAQQPAADVSQSIWSSVYKKDQDGSAECEIHAGDSTIGVTVSVYDSGPVRLTIEKQGIVRDSPGDNAPATITFDDGTVIRNVSSMLGTAFGVDAHIPDGAAFVRAFGRSKELTFRAQQGDEVKLPLDGRDDFMRELAACHQHPPVYSAAIALKNPLSVPIIAQYERLNETCRDGSEDDSKTVKACSAREALYPKVVAEGYCYGTRDDPSEADQNWHPCGPRSLR